MGGGREVYIEPNPDESTQLWHKHRSDAPNSIDRLCFSHRAGFRCARFKKKRGERKPWQTKAIFMLFSLPPSWIHVFDWDQQREFFHPYQTIPIIKGQQDFSTVAGPRAVLSMGQLQRGCNTRIFFSRCCKAELKMSFQFLTPRKNVLLTTHSNSNENKNDKFVQLGFEIVRKSAVFSARY